MTKIKTLMVEFTPRASAVFFPTKDIILELRIKLVSETQLLVINILKTDVGQS